MYTYFVSYSHSNGYGMTEVSRPIPIECFKDLQDTTSLIQKHGNLENVIILNYQQLLYKDK